jgi:hypothetical protein
MYTDRPPNAQCGCARVVTHHLGGPAATQCVRLPYFCMQLPAPVRRQVSEFARYFAHHWPQAILPGLQLSRTQALVCPGFLSQLRGWPVRQVAEVLLYVLHQTPHVIFPAAHWAFAGPAIDAHANTTTAAATQYMRVILEALPVLTMSGYQGSGLKP